jgi:hypothetical protein
MLLRFATEIQDHLDALIDCSRRSISPSRAACGQDDAARLFGLVSALGPGDLRVAPSGGTNLAVHSAARNSASAEAPRPGRANGVSSSSPDTRS